MAFNRRSVWFLNRPGLQVFDALILLTLAFPAAGQAYVCQPATGRTGVRKRKGVSCEL